MSKSSLNSKSEFALEKRKLLYWIAAWADEEEHFDHINLDISEMSVLLQSMGFRLETFEKGLASEYVGESPNVVDRNMMQINLTCPKSGMRSSLVKQTATCKCPSEEEVEKGQFWCISACGPSTSQNSINTSNSSLLPVVTPAKTKIIQALLSKVLMVINGTDQNDNQEVIEHIKTIPQLTRHRSLDTLKSQKDSVYSPRGLKRGPSWEVDPKTSPPTQTSSPLPSLCATMSKVSLNGGESNYLVKNLECIKKLVDETIELASGNNATFTKNVLPKKRVSDIKPIEGPCATDLIQLATPAPRRRLTPKKQKNTPGEKNLMAPSTRIAIRKKPLVQAASPNPAKLIRADTPRTGWLKKCEGGSGSCESIFKSKIASTLGVRAGLSPRVNKAKEAGAAGTTRFKSMSKMTLNAIAPGKKKL